MPVDLKLLSGFARDRRANFAIMAGLVGLTLVAALGGAADLSMQYRARSKLQEAVDGAALAGAKQLEADKTSKPDGVASMMVQANAPSSLAALSVTTTVDASQTQVTVRASGRISPSFLPLLRIEALDVVASATSSIQKEQHTDFYFLLDVSESMNLAASDADRDKLESWTAEWTRKYGNARDKWNQRIARPCAFACHEVEPYWASISVFEMNQLAMKEKPSRGARLRIDVVRDASDRMIDKILAENAMPGSLKTNRVATAGFSWDFQKGKDPSTDAAALKASIRSFSVANNHTRFWWAFTNFATMLGKQGSGDTEPSPRKVAILVTDGVKDEGFAAGQLGPLDTNLCKTVKDKGIDLAVLEIKYVERPQETFFQQRVASYYPKISQSLQTCATPGLYFLATDADQASSGLLKLTDAILSRRHLMN